LISGGQMSSQSPVVWWYREVVGMCVEAGPVLGAKSLTDVIWRSCRRTENYTTRNFVTSYHKLICWGRFELWASLGTIRSMRWGWEIRINFKGKDRLIKSNTAMKALLTRIFCDAMTEICLIFLSHIASFDSQPSSRDIRDEGHKH
jgi:hypothetical protein